MLKVLEQEYERSPRLKSKFTWVSDPEFTENRSKRITLSKAQKNEQPIVFDFMWDHVITSLPGPSKIDVTVLSYAYVLEIPVVTDDDDMLQLAEVFGVKTYKSLDLMKLMRDCHHIDHKKVRRIVAYWRYDEDLPKSFTSDYRRLFGEEPP